MIRTYNKQTVVVENGITKYLADIFCNSTDTKPTANLVNGSKLTEVDTGKTYLFDEANTEWVEYAEGGGGGGNGGVTVLYTRNHVGSGDYTDYPTEIVGNFTGNSIIPFILCTTFAGEPFTLYPQGGGVFEVELPANTAYTLSTDGVITNLPAGTYNIASLMPLYMADGSTWSRWGTFTGFDIDTGLCIYMTNS